MSMWRMPRSESASTTAFITLVSEPAQPASPQPLAPKRFVVAGRDGWQPDVGQITGARQLVIHERASEQLTVLVEDDALHQRLADSLCHPAWICPSRSIGLTIMPKSLTLM